jgi:hypothetical protein
MVDVRMTNGQLTVWWPNQDVPRTNVKGGIWRGPISPSSVDRVAGSNLIVEMEYTPSPILTLHALPQPS